MPCELELLNGVKEWLQEHGYECELITAQDLNRNDVVYLHILNVTYGRIRIKEQMVKVSDGFGYVMELDLVDPDMLDKLLWCIAHCQLVWTGYRPS